MRPAAVHPPGVWLRPLRPARPIRRRRHALGPHQPAVRPGGLPQQRRHPRVMSLLFVPRCLSVLTLALWVKCLALGHNGEAVKSSKTEITSEVYIIMLGGLCFTADIVLKRHYFPWSSCTLQFLNLKNTFFSLNICQKSLAKVSKRCLFI